MIGDGAPPPPPSATGCTLRLGDEDGDGHAGGRRAGDAFVAGVEIRFGGTRPRAARRPRPTRTRSSSTAWRTVEALDDRPVGRALRPRCDGGDRRSSEIEITVLLQDANDACRAAPRTPTGSTSARPELRSTRTAIATSPRRWLPASRSSASAARTRSTPRRLRRGHGVYGQLKAARRRRRHAPGRRGTTPHGKRATTSPRAGRERPHARRRRQRPLPGQHRRRRAFVYMPGADSLIVGYARTTPYAPTTTRATRT